jgi:hypothetical protein
MFTSSTIVTSAILFKGFTGTPTSIITVVMGFFVICSGVVLLQLSKSAKDVPDTAVFTGDLDQVRTIAEQEQPESEPKADAIRGAAAIVRRMSTARRLMELNEAKRLHEEKLRDLEPIGEQEQYEWDGLRRRKTMYGRDPSLRSATTTPFTLPQTPRPHPPLGMSSFPEEDDLDHDEERPPGRNQFGSLFGSIRSHAQSVIPGRLRSPGVGPSTIQSPMHPVALTEMTLPHYAGGEGEYGFSAGQKTEYEGAAGVEQRHITIVDDGGPYRMKSMDSLNPSLAPTPPPHAAKRQFSFQNVFKRGANNEGDLRSPKNRESSVTRKTSYGAKRGTEEESLGLVKGDTVTGRASAATDYDEDEYDEDEDDWSVEDKLPYTESPGRQLRRETLEREKERETMSPEEYYEQRRRQREARSSEPPGPSKDGTGGSGAFM